MTDKNHDHRSSEGVLTLSLEVGSISNGPDFVSLDSLFGYVRFESTSDLVKRLACLNKMTLCSLVCEPNVVSVCFHFNALSL